MYEQGIDLNLEEFLKHFFGFDNFKHSQKEIIENLIEGKDTMVIMPTGGGKSLCYQLPALILEGTAIVVSPLIALMKNQVDIVRGISKEDSIVHYYNSTLTKVEANKVKQDVLDKKTKLLFVAPETLNKESNYDFFKQLNISFYAVDEAHCISEWGHDFRPDFRKLKEVIKKTGSPPVIALTATATKKVQEDILNTLEIKKAKVFKSSFNRSNLYYEVRPKKNIKTEILKIVKNSPRKSGVIYCLSRKKVEEVAEFLNVNGVEALPYHAGLDTKTRTENQESFLNEKVYTIVATIAFGMGIDKPDIFYVIHHDVPKSIEGYYQETGRAGRNGENAICITFYRNQDLEKLENFLQNKPIAEKEVGLQLLNEVKFFMESSICRRKHLLDYFGESYESKECFDKKTCDNCKNPNSIFQGKQIVIHTLKSVLSLKENYKTSFLANFISGNPTHQTFFESNNESRLFGAGKALLKAVAPKLEIDDTEFWESIISQITIVGYLKKDIENYGVLRITDSGKRFLNTPHDIDLYAPKDYSQVDQGDEDNFTNQSFGLADERLFKILKGLKQEVAEENSLPPFVVFQDASLEEMTIKYPITIQELQHISGVGYNKAVKFGKRFIKVIKNYVDEYSIDRPEDLFVKFAPKKSSKKVYLIQCIDRKICLKEAGLQKNMSFEKVMDELESVVNSGTKLDLEYYMETIFDGEDCKEELFDYFMELDEFDIQKTLEYFEGVYSEIEIRFAYLSFLSEYAN